MRTATKVIEGVQSDQLHLPTPCDEMDVEALLFHPACVLDRAIAIGRGGTPFAVEHHGALEGAWDDAVAEYEAIWADDALAVAAEWAHGLGTTPEEREARLAPIYQQLPPEARELPPPFADPVPVADDAPIIDKIAAWSGRVPSWG